MLNILNILKFIWRYKQALALFVLFLTIVITYTNQRKEINELSAQRDTLLKDNAGLADGLKAVRASTAAQINALEQEAASVKKRNDDLNNILMGVNDASETVKCAVPDFVRNAFERM